MIKMMIRKGFKVDTETLGGRCGCVSMVEINLSRGRKDLDYRWIACRMQVCVNMTGTLLKVRVDIYSVSAFTSAWRNADVHNLLTSAWNRYYVLTGFCI